MYHFTTPDSLRLTFRTYLYLYRYYVVCVRVQPARALYPTNEVCATQQQYTVYARFMQMAGTTAPAVSAKYSRATAVLGLFSFEKLSTTACQHCRTPFRPRHDFARFFAPSIGHPTRGKRCTCPHGAQLRVGFMPPPPEDSFHWRCSECGTR